MKLALIDWIVVACYGLVMLAVGVAFSRRASRSVTDFFVSGRSLPWWIAGTSMVATTFAADTPLFVTEVVRTTSIAGNWIWFNFAISHALTTFFLAALWRRARVVTDVELCELRYSGPEGRLLRLLKGAFFAFVTNAVVLGWVILAMATIAKEVLGFPKLATIGASIALATIYATLAGLWGVVATDLIQFVVAMAGSLILMSKAISHLGGFHGFAASVSGLVAANGAPATRILPCLTGSCAAKGALGGFLVAIGVQWWSWKYADGGGVLIQRMSAAKNERHSVLAMLWFTFANYVVRPWPWFVVALASLVVFPELADHKAAYPRMMAEFLGPGLLGLMMAALLAAFMSTVDTHMNLAASYFVNDIYRRFLAPGKSERHYILAARLSSVAFLLLGGLIALYSNSIMGLFNLLLQLVAGAGAVFLLRWFWWRINAWSEISAMLASLSFASFLNFSNRTGLLPWHLTSWQIILFNVLVSAAVWLTVTLLTRPSALDHLVRFYSRTRPPGVWDPVSRAAGSQADRERSKGTWQPRRRLESTLLTIGLVYAALIGTGEALYGRMPQAAALLLAASLAAARLWSNLKDGERQPWQR